jgi:STE24 endopeptidase
MLDHLGVVMGRALVLGAATVVTVLLVQRYPRTWPARLTVLTAVAGPLALLLHPLIVHPLLLPSVALPEGPHRDAIVVIVAESSTPDVPILIGEASLRTTRRNAVVTGLGPTQRIVLHDTMLELDPREVAAITAHELAHVERRDPLRGVLAAVPVVLLVGLLAQRRLEASSPRNDRASKVRSLAVLAVLMLALEAASTPLSAALSRTVEHRTDVRAVELSGDVDAYVAMLRAFVVDGLAEPDPPRWSVLLWATHPPPAARIAAVIEAEARLTAPGDLAMR